jgi:uncharacterized protein YoaH (UPF0181 family)
MAEMNQSFSDRYGYRESSEPEITVREDAPEAIREGLIVVAQETGMATGGLLRIACKALRKIRKSDDNFNYTFEDELHEIITNAKWYRIYDICEKIYEFLIGYGNSDPRADEFEHQLNLLFREHGVGWQMQDGKVLARGSEGFSQSSSAAIVAMQNAGNSTAANEMHEALADISRRPKADVTGAIQHAMAALECVARNVSESKGTLGEIIPKLNLPKPLDEALIKLWGFTSERGRHVHEGREPLFEEAELVVTIASGICTYLLSTKKS